MYDFADTLQPVLSKLREEGFVPPLTVSCVGWNGTILVFRYTGTWDALSVEPVHLDDNGLLAPTRGMIVDSHGAAMAVSLTSDGEISADLWPLKPPPAE
jgi:hypothetical protein